MSAVNPAGGQKYFFDGLPFEGVAKATPVDEGVQKYWFDGLPGEYLYPAVAAGGGIVRQMMMHNHFSGGMT